MSIFSIFEKTWTTIEDMKDEKIAAWIRAAHKTVDPGAVQLQTRVHGGALEETLAKNNMWLRIVHEELTAMQLFLLKPHLFIITDAAGCALSLVGKSSILHYLAKNNMRPGTSLAKDDAGLNAVSLAMELDKMIAVRRTEHTIRFFHDWITIGCPIRYGNETVGYLCLGIDGQEEVGSWAAFMDSSFHRIDYKFKQEEASRQLEEKRFEEYRLTEREREIAGFWLQNWSTVRISHELGISEGTVRTMIKKIYAKLKVGDKGQFMRKFLVQDSFLQSKL